MTERCFAVLKKHKVLKGTNALLVELLPTSFDLFLKPWALQPPGNKKCACCQV